VGGHRITWFEYCCRLLANLEETAAAFTPDGWFITGNVGEIDAAGCVQLLGREKDIVISGGLNVYPAEVETKYVNF
jgi:long-subunit acyl-CoA synthetase (AMP-forming)